ncbi:MAG: hypothetical protein U1E93_02495 [Alphaproteobacteria bacterium]
MMMTITIPEERTLLQNKSKELNETINEITLERAKETDPKKLNELAKARSQAEKEIRYIKKAIRESKACMPKLSFDPEFSAEFKRRHEVIEKT